MPLIAIVAGANLNQLITEGPHIVIYIYIRKAHIIINNNAITASLAVKYPK